MALQEHNPFAECGYPPELHDITVTALKRGPRGQGVVQTVSYESTQGIVPIGTQVRLGDREREIVQTLVNNAHGEHAARSVGFGAMSLVVGSTAARGFDASMDYLARMHSAARNIYPNDQG